MTSDASGTRVRSREAHLRALLPHLHVAYGERTKLHIISAWPGTPLCGTKAELWEEGPLEDCSRPLCQFCASRQGEEYADVC